MGSILFTKRQPLRENKKKHEEIINQHKLTLDKSESWKRHDDD